MVELNGHKYYTVREWIDKNPGTAFDMLRSGKDAGYMYVVYHCRLDDIEAMREVLQSSMLYQMQDRDAEGFKHNLMYSKDEVLLIAGYDPQYVSSRIKDVFDGLSASGNLGEEPTDELPQDTFYHLPHFPPSKKKKVMN